MRTRFSEQILGLMFCVNPLQSRGLKIFFENNEKIFNTVACCRRDWRFRVTCKTRPSLKEFRCQWDCKESHKYSFPLAVNQTKIKAQNLKTGVSIWCLNIYYEYWLFLYISL